MTSEHKDEDIFLQEMQGVKPLQVEKKVSIKRGQVSEMSLEAKREAATAEAHVDNNHLASDFVELLDPFYPLSFKRPGVQHGVFKKLKQGRYKSEARLDLHRMTADQARKQVFEFIKESYSYDLRSLLLIPGKGSHNQANESLLKSYINRWLPELDEVQAFCSAQPQHGGLGAVYVLLAKSERKKQENRDRISRGRTMGA